MGDETLTVAAVQPPLRQENMTPMDASRVAERMMKEALSTQSASLGIDIFVLPELSPFGYSEHTFAKYLPKDPQHSCLSCFNEEVEQLFSKFAREHDVFVCFGTIGSLNTGLSSPKTDDKPHHTIRQVVLDNYGEQVAYYDKIHLCDYGDCAETRFFAAGSELCSFECRGFQVGVIICADIRYPLLSRTLALEHKVDIILQPAAFSRDFSFRTWKSFRETRAVENSLYFIGVNYAGEYFGETSFVGPWVDENNEPDVLDTNADVLIGTARKSVLEKVRKALPYYRQLMSDIL